MRTALTTALVMLALSLAACGHIGGKNVRHFEPGLNQATAEAKITEYLQKTIDHLPPGTRFVNRLLKNPASVDVCGDIKSDSPQNVAAQLEVEPATGTVKAIAAVWRSFGWEVRDHNQPSHTYVANTPDHYGLDVYSPGEGRIAISAWSPCFPPKRPHPEAHIPSTFTPRPR